MHFGVCLHSYGAAYTLLRDMKIIELVHWLKI